MRLSVIFFGFVVILNTSMAQEFRKFRVLVGAGYASGSGYMSAGVFGTVEPGYRLSDNILAGIRGEWAVIARGGRDGWAVDIEASRIRSLTGNVMYQFASEVIRPFAGIGWGVYQLSSIEYKVDRSGPVQLSGADLKSGFYPRVGFDLGHFSFSADYNIIPRTRTSDGASFRNNYAAFRLGIFFGGGRRRAP